MNRLPNSEHWREIDETLRILLALADDERDGWIDQHHGDNPRLADELRRLLRFANATGPLDEIAQSDLLAHALDALPGEEIEIGDWRLIERIGVGGMAEVFLVERDNAGIRQRAALKRMAGGLGSQDLLVRFSRERTILAKLSDARIARYFDGGIDSDGRPWLVMEYIDGLPIDRHCDENRLGRRERLRLLVEVCGAVAHAHRNLIVHRDIKPSNVLISRDGQIKLLDFGIAKKLETEDDEATHTVSRVLTPRYASPEQLIGETAGTLTDVYLLGLLLFELMAGERPFASREGDSFLLEKALREEDPPAPSLSLARRLRSDITARSSITPRELQGDLDAIALKALRKDPGQRYASVSELADDIERHLHLQPVHARRGGWRYRTIRFLRRNALAASLGTLALIALIAGLAVALVQRDLARTESRKSERVLEFMVDNFRLANPSQTNGEQISARDLLDRSAERMQQTLADVPSARADLLDAMSGAYAGLGAYDQALSLADDAIKLRLEVEAPVALARSLMMRASALKNLTRNAESAVTLAEARALLPKMPNTEESTTVKARMLSLSALLHWIKDEYEPAREEWTQSLTLNRKLYGPLDDRSIDSALFLSRALASQEDFDASARLLNEIIEPMRHANPPRPARLHETLNALGGLQHKRGNYVQSETTHREAVQLAEQVYGPEHFFVAVELHNVGKALLMQHRPADATVPLKRALAVAHVALPPTHGLTASILKNLALAEADSGNCGAAQDRQQVLLDLFRQKPESRHVDSTRIAQQIQLCQKQAASTTD